MTTFDTWLGRLGDTRFMENPILQTRPVMPPSRWDQIGMIR